MDVPRAAQKGPQPGGLLRSSLSRSHWRSTGTHRACLPVLGKEREEQLLGLETFLTPPPRLTPPTPATAQSGSFCVLDGGWGWALWGRAMGRSSPDAVNLVLGPLHPVWPPRSSWL